MQGSTGETNVTEQSPYEAAAAAIRTFTSQSVQVGLVLGSGLGGLADTVENAVSIPYSEIPGFPVSTVHGHRGELVIGQLEGCGVAVQRGRAHFYEGYTPQQVVFPIRVMKYLGAQTVILTNAAGGVNKQFRVGDIMIMNDHINFVGLAGHNPLVGPNDDSLGTRFPGMSQAYDRVLRAVARAAAVDAGVPFHEGAYCCVSGPMFESPAEIRMLRTIGADAVGMSTVHEAIAARHAGIRVLAMSGITNECIDQVDTTMDANHEEVLEAGVMIVPRMTALIRGALRGIAAGK
ncbi:MAG: purine-nucleoside phosphorylase [Pleurocapsa minor GSE-CHR-MK-17-07R]|nr:purine-nucleoside phosphorylase [Pleurocapsa minor GSE-CHR-MK 17-07R]